MPQFDLANFVPQLVWLTIFFAILYFGIVRMTLPKLVKTMDAREGQVTTDLTTAEKAKAEADQMAATYAAGIEEAHKSARAAIADAKAKAAASIENAIAAGAAVIAEKAAAADASLSAARNKALGEIESVASDAASDIVERLTGKRPDAATVATVAKQALVA
jgi:F-type H+-transporting ATPase subunit b